MDALDAFLRAEIEPLEYAAFFGALVVFGLAETIMARSRLPARRGRRWPLNYALTALNIVVLSALPISGVVVADYARDNGIGLLNVIPVAPTAALVAGFLFQSLVAWAIHLAMHKVPLLWRVHRVHHTDTFVDISTTVRFHPMEYLINTPILIGAVLLMGTQPVTLLLYELFDVAMAVFTHANIRVPRALEMAVRMVVVTPDMHRVHHSSYHRETDSNYGATLSLWDHMFRTYRHKSEADLAKMELGLKECQDARADSAWWLLSLPFAPIKIPTRPQTKPLFRNQPSQNVEEA